MARDWTELFLTDGVVPVPQSEERSEERRGFFRRLRDNMRKTREALSAEVQATLFQGDLDEETWERLEEALIYADVGARTTAEVVERLEQEAEAGDRLRRRGAHAPPVRAARRARPHRRRHDRHPPRPDGHPRRRRQRHRQDDHDRQARLAPAPDAGAQRRDRRGGHVPRRRRRAARALGRARRRGGDQGPPRARTPARSPSRRSPAAASAAPTSSSSTPPAACTRSTTSWTS